MLLNERLQKRWVALKLGLMQSYSGGRKSEMLLKRKGKKEKVIDSPFPIVG